MDKINPIPEIVGETTDVESWLIRAGLRFSDLGDDAASRAIRKQWREYQAAVQRCCVVLHLRPLQVQLGGDYAKLRIPGVAEEDAGTRGHGDAGTRGITNDK